MYVYIDTSPTVRFADESSLVWYEEAIPLAGTPEELTMDVELPTTDEMRFNNGTVYVHAHFARSGVSPNPESEDYSRMETFGVTSRTSCGAHARWGAPAAPSRRARSARTGRHG